MNDIDRVTPYAHWLLRGAIGSVFLYHGLTKFPVLNQMAEMMGLPVMIVFLVALVETVGGAMVLYGGFSSDWVTRAGAAMLVPVMLGAIFMVHWGQWSFIASETHPMGGIEFQVTLLLIQSYFVIVGNKVPAYARDTKPSSPGVSTKNRKRPKIA